MKTILNLRYVYKITFHLLIERNLAFIATITVLKDIRIAPIAGLNIIP